MVITPGHIRRATKPTIDSFLLGRPLSICTGRTFAVMLVVSNRYAREPTVDSQLPAGVIGKAEISTQGRKSLLLWWSRFWGLDLIAEFSELANHLPGADLDRSFGDRWAPFFVTHSLVQDQPD